MATSLEHRHDCAVVVHDGPLTWPATLELLRVLETAVQGYFYMTVELVVSSPGGDSRALLHLLAALALWRKKGVHFRTRVIFAAASAAAILVCSGDERIAEPGAVLLFHDVKANDTGPLSARDSADLHKALKKVDDGFIRLLVDRAVRERSGEQPSRFAALDTDRTVLELLHSGLELSRNARKPSGVRALARAVGRAVDKAARANDRTTLALVYRRLAELDRTISASLAFTLRLVDRIGPCEAENPRLTGRPGLVVPEWIAIYPPEGHVPRELLTRHMLVLGETGSGKTASVILPIVGALAQAPSEIVGAALVIDPKRELAPTLERLAPHRLRHVRTDSVVLNLMSVSRCQLDEHLTAGRWMSAAALILHRVVSLVPTSPARVLVRHEVGDSNNEFFNREGTELALCVLAFILMVTSSGAPPAEEWLAADSDALGFLELLLERARGTATEPGPNAVALAAWALEGRLQLEPFEEPSPAVSRSRHARER